MMARIQTIHSVVVAKRESDVGNRKYYRGKDVNYYE